MVAAGGKGKSKRVKDQSTAHSNYQHLQRKWGEKQSHMVQKETQEIVSQKRRACTFTGTSTSTSASKEMVAAGGTRRSKRVKVDPTSYDPVVEEESWTSSPHVSSGILVTRYVTTLTACRPTLENSSATTDETTMNGNEDVNISSSRRMVAVAAATSVHKGSKVQKTFDERFKDLKSFKAEFGHCNVPTSRTRSKNNKHLSLGCWCNRVRESYNAIKEGRSPRWLKLSKANIQRLENAGFEWNLSF